MEYFFWRFCVEATFSLPSCCSHHRSLHYSRNTTHAHLGHLQQPDSSKQIFISAFHSAATPPTQAKLLIDRVKNFTNLFVVQSGPVSVNETALNEIVDYAVAADLDVIVYFGYFRANEYLGRCRGCLMAQQRWGSSFLGVYLHDEPGGITLDANWTGYFKQISIRNSSDYYSHEPSTRHRFSPKWFSYRLITATNQAYHYVR